MRAERIILCLSCGQQNRLKADRRFPLARCARCGEALAPPQNRLHAHGWFFLLLLMAAGVLGSVIYAHNLSSTPPRARAGPERLEERTFSAPPIAISTGVAWIRTSKERIAPLEIRTSYGNDYFIKLVNASNKHAEIGMYIEGGRTFTTDVPLGTYELRYCAGSVWYGDLYNFGPGTICYEADKQFTFYRQANAVNGYTIELILQVGGNLETSRIDPSQF